MNESNVSGKFDQVAGKIKQGIGEAIGNEKLANEGAADQVKGHAKETWGNVKDAASDVHDDANAHANVRADEAKLEAERTGHDTRTSITSAAEHAKDSISRGLDHLTGNDKR
jgi:uncharacterized protein YjbJ (UPF0337 family)